MQVRKRSNEVPPCFASTHRPSPPWISTTQRSSEVSAVIVWLDRSSCGFCTGYTSVDSLHQLDGGRCRAMWASSWMEIAATVAVEASAIRVKSIKRSRQAKRRSRLVC